MRRGNAAPRLPHVLCALLLAAPPAARLALLSWERVELARDGAAAPELLAEAESLRGALRRARAELETLGAAPLPSRYRVSAGDVLPVNDPAAARDAIWVVLRDRDRVAAGAAAFWRNTLVGRVVRIYPSLSLAKIQTVADPGFSVRFRSGDVSGMLRGTGRRGPQGVVLEMHHLSSDAELPAGETVLTEGHDGIYPPDLRIGVLREDSTSNVRSQAAGRVVCAELPSEALTQVELAVDLSARSLDGLIDSPLAGERSR